MRWLAILYFLCISCKNDNNKPACYYVDPYPQIKPALDSFLKVSGKLHSVNAIYIDKTSPHNFELLLYAGSKSLTSEEDQVGNQKSIHKTRVSDIEFEVYSGVEHYFQTGNEVGKTIVNKFSKDQERLI